MAIPSSAKSLNNWMNEIDARALKLKSRASSLRTASAAGPIPRPDVLAFVNLLHEAYLLYVDAAQVTGLAAYYASQKPEETVNGADFVTFRNACETLRNWIINNFPKDEASGAFLLYVYDVDTKPTALTFSTAALADFRTHCSTLEALVS